MTTTTIAWWGLVFGQDAARGEIQAQLLDLMGQQSAGAVQVLLASVREPAEGLTATAVGLALLLVGATTVFAALGRRLGPVFGGWQTVVEAGNAVGGVLLVAFMFGLIYKVMPRQRVLATDVWLGALLAALLFTGGKVVIGAYIGRSGVASRRASAQPVRWWWCCSGSIFQRRSCWWAPSSPASTPAHSDRKRLRRPNADCHQGRSICGEGRPGGSLCGVAANVHGDARQGRNSRALLNVVHLLGQPSAPNREKPV